MGRSRAAQGEVGGIGARSAVDRCAGVAPRVSVRRVGVRIDGERVAKGK